MSFGGNQLFIYNGLWIRPGDALIFIFVVIVVVSCQPQRAYVNILMPEKTQKKNSFLLLGEKWFSFLCQLGQLEWLFKFVAVELFLGLLLRLMDK